MGKFSDIHQFTKPQSSQRPASPAAHATKQARRLADGINAIRGRVQAVVKCGAAI